MVRSFQLVLDLRIMSMKGTTQSRTEASPSDEVFCYYQEKKPFVVGVQLHCRGWSQHNQIPTDSYEDGSFNSFNCKI